MKNNLLAVISGFVFSLGLGFSGMMNPNKVRGFLNIFGEWDPSLIFVMVGALIVTGIIFPIIFKREKPILNDKFYLPTNKNVDPQLITGAIFFGAGWGVSGLCPGPAIANISSGNLNIFIFILFMYIGFFIKQKLVKN